MAAISVIIPVYQVEKYIRRCLDSLLAQTFSDFEAILVDDGSTDQSGAICEEYARKDPRFVVFHQKNQGQSVARNYALDWVYANSDSRYISFVDSDDWVHPKYLELLYEAITRFSVKISQC
jgi:glycosyltransferase involved in cell wall biosynthesis